MTAAARPAVALGIALGLLVLLGGVAGDVAVDLGRIRLGFIDVTFDQNQEDYRDPAAAEYGNSLYVAWVSKEANPELPGGGGTDTLLSRVLYVRPFSDATGRASWGDVVPLTPNSTDTLGHGNHAPFLVSYKEKLYVLWQSNDVSQKPAGAGGIDTDILYKVFDGARWSTAAQMASVEGPRGAADFDVTGVGFQGRLVIAWSRNVLATPENGSAWGEIVVRSFDGGSWSPPTVISAPTTSAVSDYPSLAVVAGRLHAVWSTRDAAGTSRWVDWSSTADGVTWSPSVAVEVQQALTWVFDPTPRITAYLDPVTGSERLALAYTALSGPAHQSAPDDTDIVVRFLDPSLSAWSAPQELTPISDRGQDSNPSLAVAGDGRLIAGWETLDDATAPGQDKDLVMRSYDGYGWSPIALVSRPGDRDQVGWQEHNLGDDEELHMATYRSKLVAVFRTFDDVTGRDGRRDIILKYLSDFDNDKDGWLDRQDACPADPREHLDSDLDGVCDGIDPRPLDPAIWQQSQVQTPEQVLGWTPAAMGIGLIALGLVVVVVVVLVVGSRTRGKEPAARSANTTETESDAGPPGSTVKSRRDRLHKP